MDTETISTLQEHVGVYGMRDPVTVLFVSLF